MAERPHQVLSSMVSATGPVLILTWAILNPFRCLAVIALVLTQVCVASTASSGQAADQGDEPLAIVGLIGPGFIEIDLHADGVDDFIFATTTSKVHGYYSYAINIVSKVRRRSGAAGLESVHVYSSGYGPDGGRQRDLGQRRPELTLLYSGFRSTPLCAGTLRPRKLITQRFSC